MRRGLAAAAALQRPGVAAARGQLIGVGRTQAGKHSRSCRWTTCRHIDACMLLAGRLQHSWLVSFVSFPFLNPHVGRCLRPDWQACTCCGTPPCSAAKATLLYRTWRAGLAAAVRPPCMHGGLLCTCSNLVVRVTLMCSCNLSGSRTPAAATLQLGTCGLAAWQGSSFCCSQQCRPVCVLLMSSQGVVCCCLASDVFDGSRAPPTGSCTHQHDVCCCTSIIAAAQCCLPAACCGAARVTRNLF